MPRPPAIKFPGYRQFDLARVEVNDATMALLVGSRLAAHLLTANAGSSAYLPEIYPAVSGIERLRLRADAASLLLRGAERHLSSMAIPYIWASYEALVESSIKILVQASKGTMNVSEYQTGMKGRHDYIQRVTGSLLEVDDLALVDLVRRIRNCIVHDGGLKNGQVLKAWSVLSTTAKARWVSDTRRDLRLAGGRLDILSGEVIGSLAVTKHMARQISSLLGAVVSKATWSKIIVDDFLANYPGLPSVVNDPPVLRRKVEGWARMYYSSAGVATKELEKVLGCRPPQEQRGSSR